MSPVQLYNQVNHWKFNIKFNDVFYKLLCPRMKFLVCVFMTGYKCCTYNDQGVTSSTFRPHNAVYIRVHNSASVQKVKVTERKIGAINCRRQPLCNVRAVALNVIDTRYLLI